MKVSCQSCGANYNLPDDKVRGKKAKVRCKKCGESIVVDGTQGVSPTASNLFDEEDEATRVMEMPTPGSGSTHGADHWTVNLSDEDQREMSTEEVVAGWVSKLVTEDAYVWRDGMDEWLPVLSSELLPLIRAAEAGGAPAPVAPVDETFPAATSGGTEAVKAAPVAAKSSPIAASPAAATKMKPLGGGKRPSVTAGLFGPLPDKSPKAAPAKQAARQPAPAAAGPKTAENSVMFSLDALKAAAAADNSAAEPDTRIPEDLLTLGTPGGFDINPLPLIQIDAPAPMQVAAMPQVTLSAGAPAKGGSLNTLVLGLIGIGLIAAVFFGVRSALTPAAPGAAAAAATAENAPRKPTAEEPTAASEAPAAAAGAAESSPEPQVKANATPTAAPVAAAATPAAKPAAGPAAAKPAKETQAAAKPAKETQAAAKPAKESGGGAAFDVGAAKDALGTAASQAKLCKTGDGPTGSGKVQVTFAPSGRVTSANVQGPPFAGTSVGGCVARAFRGARIPSFDGSPQTVSKGFTIN